MAEHCFWLLVIDSILLGFKLSTNKSAKRKIIIWGLLTMFGISPFLSWLISISYCIYVRDEFAAAGYEIILFILLFLVGTITLLYGGTKRKEENLYLLITLNNKFKI